MSETGIANFDVDLAVRKVTHRPSGIEFSFYEYHTEEDWAQCDCTIYRNNPSWIGDRKRLAAAAKQAAMANGMTAKKPKLSK